MCKPRHKVAVSGQFHAPAASFQKKKELYVPTGTDVVQENVSALPISKLRLPQAVHSHNLVTMLIYASSL